MLITKLWNDDIQLLKFALLPWEHLNLGEGLCSLCFKAAQVYDRGRTTNWDQLKTYFGLWDFEDELNWESESSQSAIAEELAEDEGGLWICYVPGRMFSLVTAFMISSLFWFQYLYKYNGTF